MTTTTGTAEFRQNMGHFFDEAQRHPITIESRGRRRAVLVSADFYGRALEALEDKLDLEAARKAKGEEEIPFETVLEELGIDPSDF